MKRMAQREVAFCDHCGTDQHVYTHCIVCGKDYCYDCAKVQAKGFKYMYCCANTVDICLVCLGALPQRFQRFVNLSRSLQGIRDETDAFYKRQESLYKDIEGQLASEMRELGIRS